MRIGIGEAILLLIIFILLFGGKRLPELSRGIKEAIKNFRESREEKEDK